MNKTNAKIACSVLVLFATVGCSKKEDKPAAAAPAASTNPGQPNPPPSGATGYVIYSDDLTSGGGAFLYPSGENQALSFSDTSGPSTGQKSMRYSWNGATVGGQPAFAGF